MPFALLLIRLQSDPEAGPDGAAAPQDVHPPSAERESWKRSPGISFVRSSIGCCVRCSQNCHEAQHPLFHTLQGRCKSMEPTTDLIYRKHRQPLLPYLPGHDPSGAPLPVSTTPLSSHEIRRYMPGPRPAPG